MTSGGFTVGKNHVLAGEKYSGTLAAGFYFPNAPKDYIRRVIEIPYSVICGAKEGPTLCVTAGMDPTEYPSIAAAIKLSQEIKPSELRGNLIVVHVSNILGFWERKYISSVDYKQLAAVFPGDPLGSASEVMAFVIFSECISKSDAYIDLHGSDGPESMLGHSAYYVTGNAMVDEKSEAMAKALGHKYVEPHKIDMAQEGGLKRGPSYKISASSGIPSALSELGEADYMLEEESNGQFNAVKNVMRRLEMISDQAPLETENQKVVDNVTLDVQTAGLFFAKAKLGEYLEKDDVIGYVKDLFGNTLEVLRAPARGTVITMLHNPVVLPGEAVVLTYGLFKG
jgi:uncharacterized protein